LTKLTKDTNGDAVVEATILFPIMIMIFAALVLLAMYLPTRAALQRATQYAATAIATEKSDSWLFFDEKDAVDYYWKDKKEDLKNVYVAMFSNGADIAAKGEDIVTKIEGRCLSSKAGVLSVDSHIVNRFIYKEASVTATRVFTMPVDLTFVKFPNEIAVTVTSTAVVQNADEFVRNMDIAVDFVEYLIEKFKLTNITDSISTYGKQVAEFLGWNK